MTEFFYQARRFCSDGSIRPLSCDFKSLPLRFSSTSVRPKPSARNLARSSFRDADSEASSKARSIMFDTSPTPCGNRKRPGRGCLTGPLLRRARHDSTAAEISYAADLTIELTCLGPPHPFAASVAGREKALLVVLTWGGVWEQGFFVP